MKSIVKTMSGMLVMAALLMTAFSSCSKDHEEPNVEWGLFKCDPFVTPFNHQYKVWREGTKISGECRGNSVFIEANEVTFDNFYFYGLNNGEILGFNKPCKITLIDDNSIVLIKIENIQLRDNLYLSGDATLTLSCNNQFSLKYILDKMVAAEGYQITVSEPTTDEKNYHYDQGKKYYNTKCKIVVSKG